MQQPQPEHPEWLPQPPPAAPPAPPVGAVPPLPPALGSVAQAGAAPPAPEGFVPRRVYAEWFAWARTRVADVQRCHAAAAAAVHGLQGGHPVTAVTETVTRVVEGAPSIAPDLGSGVRSYANWFAWAHLDMKLDQERSHAAAAAATNAQLQGLTPVQAAEAALREVGINGRVSVSKGGGNHTNAALYNLGWGVLSGVLAVFSPIYLPVAPIIGLVWGWRVLQHSKQPLVYVALAVNGVALVLNAMRFFRIL